MLTYPLNINQENIPDGKQIWIFYVRCLEDRVAFQFK